jgi:hypothetical protein
LDPLGIELPIEPLFTAAVRTKDGSASFSGQHGSASKPNNVLAAFLLGPLVAGGSLPAATVRGDDEAEEEGDED